MTANASAKRVSELRRAEETEGVLCQTHIGGQALIEGVMMRGKYSWAAAVRTPDGSIYTEEHDLTTSQDKHGWLYWPVIRGCRALVESLVLGYKALEVAANNAFDFDEDEDDGKAEKKAGRGKDKPEKIEAVSEVAADDSHAGEGQSLAMVSSSDDAEAALSSLDVPGEAIAGAASIAIDAPAKETVDFVEVHPDALPQAAAASAEPVKPAGPASGKEPTDAKKAKEEPEEESKAVIIIGSVLGIVLGLALFIFAPAFIANLIVGDYDSNIILWNVVDGVLRVAIFILYIWLISFMKDIKRMFRYHGAEHKTIHCFEHGLELTPENARQFPTLHVRCGTAFLIMTLILAIIVFSCVPVKAICIGLGLTEGVGQFLVIVLSRIVFIPVVAGLGYELTVKWAGSHPEKKIVRVVLWPGLQMQRLTTGEPDDSMLECAIAAMKIVLERERREEAKAGGGESVSEPAPAPFCGDIAAASPASASGGTALTESL